MLTIWSEIETMLLSLNRKIAKISLGVIRMINKKKLYELVKSYLPQTEPAIIDDIANNVIRDAESIIYSMVRQAVNQERENLYKKNNKD